MSRTTSFDDSDIGPAIYALIERLFPICRSITGDGVRRTLDILGEHIALERHEVPTGTPVFDWIVPPEWNIRDAYIKGPDGRKIVDFRKSNLHVVSYSTPVRARLSLAELLPHLHSLPEHPDWIPYRTAYYNPDWGFCLAHRQRESLTEGEYEVVIDSELKDGALSYAECRVPGARDDEVLVFAHICHPSLCNDNLSGIGIAVQLAKFLASAPRVYSYRFVFAPATIGSITWLSRNESRLGKVKHGLVAAVLGDPGMLHYKKSRQGDAEIDRAVQCALRDRGTGFKVLEFSPWGYDERQFGSPGIALPVGRLTRTPNGCYPEYHSSADDLSLVRPEFLADSFRAYVEVFAILERNRCYRNLSPKGEPQLGRRGLYRKTGGQQDIPDRELALLWVLNQSDGGPSLLDIAERSGLAFASVAAAARDLEAAGLLAPVSGG
jgi:aminopeptidase-like protein